MRPTWAEIDLEIISKNTSIFSELLDDSTELCAVVKADGYGHGATEVAKKVLASGATWLAVAFVEEAAALRREGIEAPILILSEPRPNEMEEVVKLGGVRPTIYTRTGVEAFSSVASKQAPVHLKVDTGMHRVGVRANEIIELVNYMVESEIELEGVFTHFALASTPKDPFNKIQIELFDRVLEELADAGHVPEPRAAGLRPRRPDALRDLAAPVRARRRAGPGPRARRDRVGLRVRHRRRRPRAAPRRPRGRADAGARARLRRRRRDGLRRGLPEAGARQGPPGGVRQFLALPELPRRHRRAEPLRHDVQDGVHAPVALPRGRAAHGQDGRALHVPARRGDDDVPRHVRRPRAARLPRLDPRGAVHPPALRGARAARAPAHDVHEPRRLRGLPPGAQARAGAARARPGAAGRAVEAERVPRGLRRARALRGAGPRRRHPVLRPGRRPERGAVAAALRDDDLPGPLLGEAHAGLAQDLRRARRPRRRRRLRPLRLASRAVAN